MMGSVVAGNPEANAHTLREWGQFLEVVTNPQAAKAVVDSLNSKNNELLKNLQEAKDHHEKGVAIQKEVEVTGAKVASDAKDNADKEADLRSREEGLSKNLSDLEESKRDLANAKVKFDDEAKIQQAKLDEVATKLFADKSTFEANVRSQREALETEYQAKLKDVEDLRVKADKAMKDAISLNASAEERLRDHDARLAALRNIIT